MPEQLAHPPRKQGRRAAADLHSRRGLVPGGGQARREPGARHGRYHPGRGQALARSEGEQLVQPHRCRGSRREHPERMVRAGFG